MRSFSMLCATAVIAMAMTACNQTPTTPAAAPDTHDADVKAIADNEVQWNQDYVAKDLDKVAAHYADDAVLIVPGSEAVSGKDGIRAALKQLISDPALSLTFKPSKIDVSKSGEMGYTEGAYQMTATDPATHKKINDHGSYVETYRKQADGAWRVTVDIATSAVPPAPPKHK